MLGVRNRWLAYQVDEAIEIFGLGIEAKLNKSKDAKSRERKLKRLLSEEGHYVLDIDPAAWADEVVNN